MATDLYPVPAALVCCVSTGRAPTVQELEAVAARIWIEGASDRSAFAWGRLEPSSRDRIIALRAALASTIGSQRRTAPANV